MFMFQFISMYFQDSFNTFVYEYNCRIGEAECRYSSSCIFDNCIAGELTMLEADPARPHIARAFFTHGRGKKVRALGVFI